MTAPKDPARHTPFNIELEQALIGAMLRDNTQIDRAAEVLDGAHFYDPLHARLYEMIVHLQGEGEEVSPLILHSVMKTDPGLIETGGQPYLDALYSAAPALPNTPQLAKHLRDLAQRRALIQAGEDMINSAYAPPTEAPTARICEDFQGLVDEITSGTSAAKSRKASSAADAASEMLRRIEEQANSPAPYAVSTGLDWLDKLLGGLIPGKFWVVAGRPSMGKSQLATNIARNAASRIPVDYLCGEDGDELPARIGADIDFDRAAAEGLKPLKYGDFLHLKASDADMERMALATGRMRELDLTLFDVSGMTLEWIEATCRRRARQQPGHRLVVIDHLQLVGWNGARRGASRLEIQTEITKRLQALAKELGFTIIALSQLSRDVEKRDDKHPQLADLREGGSIEQDANVVIGIMRPLIYARQKIQASRNDEQRSKAILEYDDAKDVLAIAVLKNKGGRTTEYSKVFIKPEASAIRDRAPATGDGTQTTIDWGKLAEDLAG